MKKVPQYLVILALLLCLLAMKCNNDSSVETAQIHPELKEFLDFKEGSWWVYRDSVSGVMDCTYVFDYGYVESDEQYLSNVNLERLGYDMIVFDRHIVIGFSPQWKADPELSEVQIATQSDTITNSLFPCTGWSEEPGFPLVNTTFHYLEFSTLDSLVVVDSVYHDVMISELIDGQLGQLNIEDAFIQKSFLVRGVGFVKIVRPDRQVLELVRYSTIQ